MSWSLQIANGDLAASGNGMATITGGAKLVQDLAAAVLEPMGTDSMHPSFGSTIDGGTTPDGTYNAGIIGHNDDSIAAAYVDAELRRIAAQQQAQQQARYTADIATYGRATLTPDEVLLAVETIVIQAAENHMLVTAQLQTGTGVVEFAAPISAS